MTSSLSFFLILFGTLVSASAALFIKKGINAFPLRRIYQSKNFRLGFFLYLASTVIYLVALRGGELSVLYPLVATTYLWATLFSVKYLDEEMNKWKWISLIGIIIGVLFVGFGS